MSTAWMRQAACRTADPELFFPGDEEEEVDERMTIRQISAARAVCRHCPVAMRCFEWAMANRKLTAFGVWGMTVPSQRDEYRCTRNARERESA